MPCTGYYQHIEIFASFNQCLSYTMNTKMIVTGDMTQIDLPASQTSGLVQALRILKGVKGISFVELNKIGRAHV